MTAILRSRLTASLGATLVVVLLIGSGLGARPAAAAVPIAVSITDNVTSAHPGQQLTYQVTITNGATTDTQLLLEVTIPDGATVLDAGGGTIRQSLIDYGVTVLGDAHVSEKFVLALGSTAAATQQRADTVASIYLLGGAAAAPGSGTAGSTTGPAASLQATDSDQIGATRAGAATHAQDAASAGGGPAHRGLWIAALVAGALMVLVGVVLALRGGSPGGRRRRARGTAPLPARIPPASQPPPLAPRVAAIRRVSPELPHPGRSATRAARAAADAGIRTGTHQARRAAR